MPLFVASTMLWYDISDDIIICSVVTYALNVPGTILSTDFYRDVFIFVKVDSSVIYAKQFSAKHHKNTSYDTPPNHGATEQQNNDN